MHSLLLYTCYTDVLRLLGYACFMFTELCMICVYWVMHIC